MMVMVVVLVVVLALVVWLLVGIRNGESVGTTPRKRNAEQILAERFARGEIDEEEFARRRETMHPA